MLREFHLPAKNKVFSFAGKTVLLLVIIFCFLLSIELIGNSFLALRKTASDSLLMVTNNPFIGLFIGLLLTAIIQSSSTSTSMIVALVGSGALSLSSAVPMVMGANIGTTLTSTLASLSFITSKKEFRKGIAAATIHDFFNIFLTIILLPLEYYYKFLSKLSLSLTSLVTPFFPGTDEYNFSFMEIFFTPISEAIINTISINWLVILISFFLLLVSIKILSLFIYHSLIGKYKDMLNEYVFKSNMQSFTWGLSLTAVVQSSSITTPLIVPLVATGKLKLEKAFPFVMGANMGTTFTALVAAMFKTEAALTIAVTHLLFNLIGILLFFSSKFLRNQLLYVAAGFGKITMKYRLAGFVYIILTFFILPFALIYMNKKKDGMKNIQNIEYRRKEGIPGNTLSSGKIENLTLKDAPEYN